MWKWELDPDCVHWGCRLTQSTDDSSFHPCLKNSLVGGCRSKELRKLLGPTLGRHHADRPTDALRHLTMSPVCIYTPGWWPAVSALNLPGIRVVTRRLMVPPRISARPDPINTLELLICCLLGSSIAETGQWLLHVAPGACVTTNGSVKSSMPTQSVPAGLYASQIYIYMCSICK